MLLEHRLWLLPEGQEYCSPQSSLPLPCCRALSSRPWAFCTPSQLETAPRYQKKKQRQRGSEPTECLFLSQLYEWLCGPGAAPHACLGQPLAHTLIGHVSDGGDLKEQPEHRESVWETLSEMEHSWGRRVSSPSPKWKSAGCTVSMNLSFSICDTSLCADSVWQKC